MKQKQVTLSFPHGNLNSEKVEDQFYRVEQVRNSTDPAVGKRLSKREVDDLCAARDWDVIIRPHKE